MARLWNPTLSVATSLRPPGAWPRHRDYTCGVAADGAPVTLDAARGERVGTVNLNGPLTDTAAPDLIDAAPSGERLFVGLGVIQITEGGRNGSLVAIVPMTNAMQQPKQAPDPHGLRVRLRR